MGYRGGTWILPIQIVRIEEHSEISLEQSTHYFRTGICRSHLHDSLATERTEFATRGAETYTYGDG